MSAKRFLLVQCCHLPHFFFVAKKLREQHPDAHFDALMADHPQARFYAGLFPLFENVFFGKEAERLEQYDGIVFPLLSRGYRHIKNLALGKGPLLRVDYSGNLNPLGHLRLLGSAVYVTDKPTAEFVSYLEEFPHRVRPERVLLIESCHASLLAKAKSELRQVMQEGADVTQVRKAPLRKLFGRYRGQEFDTACVFFSGERGFLGLKLLPFLLRIRRIVIINENRNFFEASATSLARFLYKRIRYGAKLPFPLPPRIVLFQTETVGYLRHAASRLKQRRLFPHSELIVVCRPEDRAEAEAIPEVNRVLCYPKRSLWRYYRLWRKLDRLQPDLACGIFSGRSVHRWEKLLFFLLPASQHLAFNAQLDCYRVSMTRLLWMFRSEPLVFDEQLQALSSLENYILLLQTTDDRKMLKAIARLRDPRIANPAPIAVFCSQDKRALFQGIRGVRAVYTFQPGKRWEAARAFFRLRKLNVDVLSAVLTGERYPGLHKLLFLLLPARNRLIFNPDFNCFYLNRLNPFGVLPLLRSRAYPKRGNLFLQTADDATSLRALAKLRDPRIARRLPITVFCSEDKRELFEAVPGVTGVYTYPANQPWATVRAALRLRKLNIDVLSTVLAGERYLALYKLLFLLLLPARNRLVFNPDFNCFYLNRLNLLGVLRLLRFRGRRGNLFLQTADDATSLRALAKLRDPRIARRLPITVFCSEDKRELFEAVPGVTGVCTYPANQPWATVRAALRLRKLNIDVLSTVLAGERYLALYKLLFLLLPARNRLVFNPDFNCFYLNRLNLLGVLRLLRFRGRRGNVFIQTADDATSLRALAKLRDPRIARQLPITVFCSEDKRELFEAVPGVKDVCTYPANQPWATVRTALRLRKLNIDVLSAVLAGERYLALYKLLFLLLPARNRLVFNPDFNCFYLNRLNLLGVLRLLRFRARRGNLFLQTADDATSLRALAKLQDPRIARQLPITVFCAEDKRELFEAAPGVKDVCTYPANQPWATVRAALRLRKLNIDVLAGVLAGGPSYRLLKLLFFALPASNRLVLNRDLNCFYLRRLNPLSLLQLLRVGSRRCILLIQTAEDSAILRALVKVRDPNVTRPAPIIVFCRQDKKDAFARLTGVEAVYTYEPNKRWRAMRTLVEVFRLDVEVAIGLFTGESIFRLQKLLFFLIPTRNRLVFNHNLDCYYLNRTTFWSLFRSEERLGQLSSTVLVARLVGKALLFLPRFFFLVIWVTGQKLKRAYILATEVR